MKAAGDQTTHRRRTTYIASADRIGPSVNATLSVATGPKSHVIGASTTPIATTLVFAKRLTPCGWLTNVEKNGLRPCVIA